MPRKHFIELAVRIPYQRDDLVEVQAAAKQSDALKTEMARIITHYGIVGAVLTSRIVSVKE